MQRSKEAEEKLSSIIAVPAKPLRTIENCTRISISISVKLKIGGLITSSKPSDLKRNIDIFGEPKFLSR